MKVDDLENWPADAAFSLLKTKFRLATDREPTIENMQEWFKTGDNTMIKVALFANPETIKNLDTQVPTTDMTYRQYLLLRGIINWIIEDFDGLTKAGEVYLLRV